MVYQQQPRSSTALSDAFEAGFSAFFTFDETLDNRGKMKGNPTNPYYKDSLVYKEWERGYNAGYDKSKTNPYHDVGKILAGTKTMEIKLDSRKVVNLINDWARKQYKTKNVSSCFDLSVKNDVTVDVEVTLSDIDMDSYHSSISNRFVEELSNKIKNVPDELFGDVPTLDFSGTSSSVDAPI